MPSNVVPPRPLLGRNRALHVLAKQLGETNVVTVVGTGGIGKTALVGALATRFGQRLSAARHDLAALLQCATNYLRGQPHNIPARYTEQWATWI